MTSPFPVRVVVEGSTGRTVLLCMPDPVPSDPDPETTWARGVTLLTADTTASDPTEAADRLAGAILLRGSDLIGVVGWAEGGLTALVLATRHPALVDRLVMIGTPVPPLAPELDLITAKTLLLYGAKDPTAGPRDGKWYQQRLPDRRYEQIPGEGRLLLGPVWRRTLSHLAPNHRRPATAAGSPPEPPNRAEA
jgi:pimeloyl-ACP methyl ester carboxylesterase